MTPLLAIAFLLLSSETAPPEERTTARVCFLRHEDGGRLDQVPVRIYGAHAERTQLLAILVGGAQTCVDVEPGGWSFDARSGKSDGRRDGNPNACRSNPFMTEATIDATTTIEVSPKSKGAKSPCGWRLRRQGDSDQAPLR